MDFELSEEHRMLQDLVAKFVDNELMPLESAVIARDIMGMTKELPLQLMAQKARLMRIYEGPSEVHRMVIARRTLAAGG